MAGSANGTVLRSNLGNDTGVLLPDFTTAVPCTSKDCEDEDGEIPQEAVIFLCAVLFFVLLLVIFFLYLNKSLCFSECGGFPCIDKVPEKNNSLDSDTDDELHEVHHTSIPPARSNKDAPLNNDANPSSRKSRSRSRVTAADGGEAHDGNGSSVQDGGKSNLYPGAAATSIRYTRLQ